MTAASSLPFPSGRTLAGWWKQLSAHAPRGWWVGHLFVHRVEAAVQVREAVPLPPLAQVVLESVRLAAGPVESAAPESQGPESQGPESQGRDVALADLEETLQLPRPLLGQYLRQLSSEGLLEPAAADRWKMTGAGREALAEGANRTTHCRRQTFSFVERRDPAGARSLDPFFVPLEATPAVRPWSAAEGFAFDVAWLEQCLARDRSWKRSEGFPLEVEGLLKADARNGCDLPAWKKIVVDRLEELTVALVQGRDDPERIVGFAVSPSDWRLDVGAPILSRRRDSTPPLQEESSGAACREAWLAWARLRNLPAHEVEACKLSLEGTTLTIRGPRRLLESLRQTKSDLLKGEAWVLLGNGYMRQAARLELE